MKINLAVYTAQEGYSWQPGTAFTTEELIGFKKCIGKFPAPDSSEFPFGGVFLLDDRVVFYRYHVAKKIDFRGRDALYCVLGAVSRADAAKIDPAALFARPEFAGPMRPFPTALELPEADPSAVPEWLKNLDKMTLDVRITGSADKPDYAVALKPQETAQPPAPPESQQAPQPPTPALPEAGKPESAPVAQPPAPEPSVPVPPPSSDKGKKPWLRRWMIWYAAALAAIALAALVVFLWKGKRHRSGGGGSASTNLSSSVQTNDTSAVSNSVPEEASNSVQTNDTSAVSNSVPEEASSAVQTNTSAVTTNTPAAATPPKATPAAATPPKATPAPGTKPVVQQTPKQLSRKKEDKSPATTKPAGVPNKVSEKTSLRKR